MEIIINTAIFYLNFNGAGRYDRDMINIDLPLRTERLTLRDITGEDTFAFAKIATHPRMMRKIVVEGEEKNVPMYVSFFNGVEAFIDLSLAAQRQQPRTLYSLAVIDNTSKKVIGSVELSENDLGDVELGYCMHPDFQHQGLTFEAVVAVCTYAFQRGVQAITATTRGDNKQSQALLKRLGMKLIGYKPTSYSDGMPIREYWMVERIPFLVALNTAQQKTAASATV